MSLELLEWLKTPMAAPESGSLRALRFTILGTCLALLVIILFFADLLAVIGPAIAGGVAGLLSILMVLVPVYVGAKNRADDAFLDRMVADDGRAGE